MTRTTIAAAAAAMAAAVARQAAAAAAGRAERAEQFICERCLRYEFDVDHFENDQLFTTDMAVGGRAAGVRSPGLTGCRSTDGWPVGRAVGGPSGDDSGSVLHEFKPRSAAIIR